MFEEKKRLAEFERLYKDNYSRLFLFHVDSCG